MGSRNTKWQLLGGAGWFATLVAMVAVVGVFALVVLQVVNTGAECTVRPPLEEFEAVTAPINLTTDPAEHELKVAYGTDRGTKDTFVARAHQSAVPQADLPAALDVSMLPLQRGSDQIDGSATAMLEGRRYVVTVCIDPKTAPPGTYNGRIEFVDEQVSADPIPVSVTLKSRWAHALGFGGVLVISLGATLFALFIAGELEDRRGKNVLTNRRAAFVIGYAIAVGAAYAVAATQIQQNEVFGTGGGAEWLSYPLVFASMWSASVGAVATAYGLEKIRLRYAASGGTHVASTGKPESGSSASR